jgi:hypothetical protein
MCLYSASLKKLNPVNIMKKINYLLIGAILLLFVSCAKKIDGTSEESMASSIGEIKQSLSEQERNEFEDALKLIMFQDLDFADIMKGEKGAENVIGDVKSKLNGMTATDVVDKGKKIKLEIERKKKEQAKIEVADLYEKQVKTAVSKAELQKFEVIKSRFYKRKSGEYYVTYEPIIELTVKNGMDQAISTAYFEGTLASPNRTIPWLKDEFNYEISGGLELNEEATWRLAPNMFSDWGEVKAPKDAVLTVDVLRLDDAEGNELYSVKLFGKEEQERLNELLKQYPEFSN